MNNSIGRFELLLSILTILDLASMMYIPGLRLITKPLIITAIIVWYLYHVRDRQRNVILLALLFSMIGDTLLVFNNETMFLSGVGAFFVAQIAYTSYFKKFSTLKSKESIIKVALILLVAASFYLYIMPHLGSLKIPVLVYSVALAAMVITGVTQKLSPFISIGAFLFMISDISLAIGKFVMPKNTFIPILVMITYVLAQYFLIKGVIQACVPSVVVKKSK